MPEKERIQLKINYLSDLSFKWQMYFDRFSIEESTAGKTISFAATYDGQASEIVPIFVSREALGQLRGSAEAYLPGLANSGEPDPKTEKLPVGARRFSPLFSNHVRLSRSGDTAEFIFYTIPLSFIADAIQGRANTSKDTPLIPVAIFHSEVPVHYRLLAKLLIGVTPSEDIN